MLAHTSERARSRTTGSDLERRYRVGRRIGKGSSSIVYAATALTPAHDDHGRRRVAVKLLAQDQVGDGEAIARFTHEAFLSAHISHPNLVPVLDFGWAERGRPYFVMPRCAGVTLDRILLQAASLPRDVALGLLADTAEALQALHAHGIVHRDVKPSNIFCAMRRGSRTRALLIDLGVAGVFDPGRAEKLGAVNVGARGTYGTPAYIAPEQALGRHTDSRADIYSLACVAYRLLAGVEPFPGSSVTAAVKGHLFQEARPASRLNPALSAAVDAVLARGMAKDPEERTESVVGFVAELREALGL